MSQLTSNLSTIYSIKQDIKSAIEAKGVDMTGMSFQDYPGAIANIPAGAGYTEKDITEGLSFVSLNNSASYVGSFAFYWHSELVTVNLPNCTSLSKGAFQSCSYLQTATLPNCTHLGNLSINEGNNWVFKSCSRLTSVSVPACIEIGADGFMGCSLLPSIDLPCCLRMDANAFRSCYALSQVSLPVCTDIGGGVFYSCGSLSQVSLPRWLNNSGNSVFQGCTLLNSLTLCTDVYWTIPYQNRMLSNTPIMSGTGSIYVRSDTYSFWIASTGWSSLADRFVSIECSSPALSYSDGLLYGETPLLNSGFASYLGISNNSVTRVELSKCVNLYDNALSGCTAMSKVSLPVCSYVGHLAFYVYQGVHCDFILGYSGVVATNGQLFDGNQDISIYVPASLVDAYKVAPVWSNRSAYIFPISE